MVGKLEEIPSKPSCPCKLPFDINAKPPHPLESMQKILPNPMCWTNRRNHGWYVCLGTSVLLLWLFLVIQWCSLSTAGNLHDTETIKDPHLYFSSWLCSYAPPVLIIPHCSSKPPVSTPYSPFLFILSGWHLDWHLFKGKALEADCFFSIWIMSSGFCCHFYYKYNRRFKIICNIKNGWNPFGDILVVLSHQ